MTYSFYSTDYSIAMQIDQQGVVMGIFVAKDSGLEVHEFRGISVIDNTNNLSLAFSIRWSSDHYETTFAGTITGLELHLRWIALLDGEFLQSGETILFSKFEEVGDPGNGGAQPRPFPKLGMELLNLN